MSNPLPLILFGLLFLIVFQYSNTMLASTDIGVNTSSTAYHSVYNNSTGNVRATMSFTGFMEWFVAIAAIVGAMLLIMPKGYKGGI